MEVRECPPSTQKTSMLGPLRGSVGGLGASTTQLEDVDGGPPGPPEGFDLHPWSKGVL
jgi:hypothetical protein